MHINEKLFSALAKGDRDIARDCIARGADINGSTDIGEKVWSFVAPAGEEAVGMALKLGADPNSVDIASRSALYWAIHANDPVVLRVLLKAGASWRATIFSDGSNLLHEAALAGASEILAEMLKCAPRELLTEKNVLGETPFDEAQKAGHLLCVEVLKIAERYKEK